MPGVAFTFSMPTEAVLRREVTVPEDGLPASAAAAVLAQRPAVALPRIFVINLDRDSARLANIRRQLSAAGLDFERQPGVLASNVPDPLRRYFLTTDGKLSSTLRLGEVGCYASHLAIHDRVANGQFGRALILEDDINIPLDFSVLLRALLAVMPVDWDIVRLSNPPKRSFVAAARIDDRHELVRYTTVPNTAGAYLISPSGAKKFLSGATPRWRAIDEDMRCPWEFGLHTLGVVPPPCSIAAGFGSSIDDLEDRGLAPGMHWRKLIEIAKFVENFHRARDGIKIFGLSTWLRCLGREMSNELRRQGRANSGSANFSRFRVS